MRQLLQRHWGWLLSLSIAGNVAAGSYWVARTLRHRERVARSHQAERPWRPPGEVRARPSAGRGKRPPGSMAWLSRPQRRALRAKHQQLHQLRGQAENTLRAEPFDVVLFGQQLDSISEQMRGIQQDIHQLLIEQASEMSVEERQQLATHSWGPLKKRGRRSRRYGRSQ